MAIVRGIRCRRCGDAVWSRHRHDMRRCRCGESAVDGGREYFKMVGPGDAMPEVVDVDTDTGEVVDGDEGS